MPVVIEAEAENARMLAIVEPMMSRDLSSEEAKLFDWLVKLIEDFKERHYPMEQSSPTEMLQFLMEQRGHHRDVVHLLVSAASLGKLSKANPQSAENWPSRWAN